MTSWRVPDAPETLTVGKHTFFSFSDEDRSSDEVFDDEVSTVDEATMMAEANWVSSSIKAAFKTNSTNHYVNTLRNILFGTPFL